METSYTGVGAFSSAPAPNTNALVAASVIGNALKANNHNPVGLNIPRVQPPRANRYVRAASITNDSQNSLRSSQRLPDNFVAVSRANSINTANARRMSLTSMPKNRLSGQKSVPNLNSRRSVSDFGNPGSGSSISSHRQSAKIPVYYKPEPKTIKKYVASVNGLVAVEVPNPKYKERTQSFRRSVSVANVSGGSLRSGNQYQQSSRVNSMNFQQNSHVRTARNTPSTSSKPSNASRSITKNVSRETKILPNGTKVVSTTVREYIDNGSDEAYDEAFDDAYDDFDDVHRPVDMSITLDEEEDEAESESQKPIDSTQPVLQEIDEIEEDAAGEGNADEDEAKTQKAPLKVQKEAQGDPSDKLHKEENDSTENHIGDPANASTKTLDHNIAEDDVDEVIDELATEKKYEDEVKNIIAKNEEVERFEREKAFKSVQEPVQDPVIIEDIMSRKLLPSVVPLGFSNGMKHSGVLSAGLLSEASKASESLETEIENKADEFSDMNLEPAVEEEKSITKNNDFDGVKGNSVNDSQTEAANGFDAVKHENSEPVDDLSVLTEVDDEEGDYADDIDEGDYVDDIAEGEDMIEDFSTRDLTAPREEEYTEEELLAAQMKLDELVKRKEKEILNELMRSGDVKAAAADHPNLESETNDFSDNETNVSQSSETSESDQQPAEKELTSTLATTKESPELLAKTSTAQTDESGTASDADLIFHTSTNTSSKELSDDLEEPSALQVAVGTDEKFYTPPVTPVVPLTNGESFEMLESPAATLQPSVHSYRRSESPESSMIRNEDSFATTPIQSTRSNKSMAQHLRPSIINSNLNSPKNMAGAGSGSGNGITVPHPSERISKPATASEEDSFANNTAELAQLRVPDREASLQAKIDLAEKRKTLNLDEQDIPDFNNVAAVQEKTVEPTLNNNNNNNAIGRRKSVLKNSSSVNNRSSMFISNGQNNDASGAYLSLATAQNTKLNAMGSSTAAFNGGLASTKIQGVNALESNMVNRSRSGSASGNSNVNGGNNDFTPLAAAARAAQRHSIQPSSKGFNGGNSLEQADKKSNRFSAANFATNEIGGVKAPNPKVEEAKRRILQNRRGQTRAKELYELAKSRPPVNSEYLMSLDDSGSPRRSSFEKTNEQPDVNNSAKKGKMASMSLRDVSSLNYEQYERKKPASRGFKSRFQDDNSDTDLPLPPLQPQTISSPYSSSANPNAAVSSSNISDSPSPNIHPAQSESTKSGFKLKFSSLSKKKSKVGMNNTNTLNISAPIIETGSPTQVSQNAEATSAPRRSFAFSGPHLHHESSHEQSNSAPFSESRFEKFFSEPHGPGKRNVSTASNATSGTVVTNEEGKKKRGFRFKKLFGDR